MQVARINEATTTTFRQRGQNNAQHLINLFVLILKILLEPVNYDSDICVFFCHYPLQVDNLNLVITSTFCQQHGKVRLHHSGS